VVSSKKPALGFSPDHQDLLRLATLDIGITQFQSMQKTGALLANIKRRDVFSTQFMLQNNT
jgi:hypothetical protein